MNGSAESGPVMWLLGHLTALSCSLEYCVSYSPVLVVVAEELAV